MEAETRDPASDEEEDEARRPASAADVGIEIVRSITRIVLTVLEHLLKSKVLITFGILAVALVLGYTALLQPEDRLRTAVIVEAVLGAMHETATSQLLTWGGYGLALIVLAVCGGVIKFQDGRIRSQGRELSSYRKALDPKRVSSNSVEEIEEYGKKIEARARVGDEGESDATGDGVEVAGRREPASKKRAKKQG